MQSAHNTICHSIHNIYRGLHMIFHSISSILFYPSIHLHLALQWNLFVVFDKSSWLFIASPFIHNIFYHIVPQMCRMLINVTWVIVPMQFLFSIYSYWLASFTMLFISFCCLAIKILCWFYMCVKGRDNEWFLVVVAFIDTKRSRLTYESYLSYLVSSYHMPR